MCAVLHAVCRAVLQETSRLAVVDLDWANITATDILAVMRSFDPHGGKGEEGRGRERCTGRV